MKKLLGPALNKIAPYLVLVLGFFTYFVNYEKPPNLYWDENYYLTAVEKYKKEIFFQESHPPLGKLIMFVGERIMDPNPNVHVEFEKSDFARNIPPGYSFKGVRFFPAFFGWINCVLIFVLLLTLTKSAAWGLVLSFFYMVDNALIVHSRGAMLDSTQIFGVLVALIAYFRIYLNGRFSKPWAAVLGAAIMWATWTKLNGLIIILLLPLLIFHPQGKGLKDRVKECLPAWGISFAAMFIVTILVFGTHFSIGKRLEPALNNNGWYRATAELKSIVQNPEGNPNFVRNFYIEFRDYMEYINNYAKGVPRLNLCKKGENGSPFYWWPLGARAINYRWETQNQGQTVSYLYLVPNPLAWGIAFLCVILSFAYFLMKVLFGNIGMKKEDEKELLILTILYFCYMLSIARIDRVMYTYHYFIPLIFSFAMIGKWIPHIVSRIRIGKPEIVEGVAQVVLMIALTMTWHFYSPFTYYKPISCIDFQKRMLQGWQMSPVQCREYKEKSIFQPPFIPPPPPRTQPKDATATLKQVGRPAEFKLSTSQSLTSQPRTTNSLPSKPQR